MDISYLSQSGPGSNGTEGVLYIPQSIHTFKIGITVIKSSPQIFLVFGLVPYKDKFYKC